MTATKTRPNTYAGNCRNCGSRVPAQAGLLGGKVDGRWTVLHTECPASAPASRWVDGINSDPRPIRPRQYYPRNTRGCNGDCMSFGRLDCRTCC